MQSRLSEVQGFKGNRKLQLMIIGYSIIWLLLAIKPTSRGEWLLENVLTIVTLATLALTYRKFRFSNASYFFIFLFLCFHTVGAHYTYQQTPLDDWLKSAFHTKRSYYDRLVHFLFGLLLVYPVREWLVRLSGLSRLWAAFLPVTILVSFSGCFEIVEMRLALLVNAQLAQDYVGMQGDIWDSVKDIEMGLVGAICAAVVLQWTGFNQTHQEQLRAKQH